MAKSVNIFTIWSLTNESIENYFEENKGLFLPLRRDKLHLSLIMQSYNSNLLPPLEKELIETTNFLELLEKTEMLHAQLLTYAIYRSQNPLSKKSLTSLEKYFTSYSKSLNSKVESSSIENTKTSMIYSKGEQLFNIIEYAESLNVSFSVFCSFLKYDISQFDEINNLLMSNFFEGSTLTLRCGGFEFDSMYSKLPILPGVKILDFSNCGILSLKGYLFKCLNENKETTIEEINLNNNKLSSLKCEFFKGTKILSCSGNRISEKKLMKNLKQFS